ncbi:MAG: phosphatase PAP2 family protein [Bacteroidota bacterium]
MIKRHTLLLLLVITSSGLLAQIDTIKVKKEHFFRRITNDGKLAIQTIGATYARPASWQKRDWIRLGGAIGISATVTLLDRPISNFFRNNQNKVMDRVSKFGDFMGQPDNNYPFLLAVWSSGVIFNNEWLRDTGIMLFASITTSGLLQTFSKELVGRARPLTGDGVYGFRPFDGTIAYHSFPSGHTMLALATSWVMAHQVKFKPLKIFFYSVPVIVGVARIYDQAHWASDVLLGSALGIACAETVIRVYPKFKEKLQRNQGLLILPTGRGVSLTYRF